MSGVTAAATEKPSAVVEVLGEPLGASESVKVSCTACSYTVFTSRMVGTDRPCIASHLAQHEPGRAFDLEPEDPATGIHSTQREAHAGWFRTVPCPPNACGEHGFHLKPLGEDEPTGSARRGAWFGVWFQ